MFLIYLKKKKLPNLKLYPFFTVLIGIFAILHPLEGSELSYYIFIDNSSRLSPFGTEFIAEFKVVKSVISTPLN